MVAQHTVLSHLPTRLGIVLANTDEIPGNGPPVFDDAPMSPDEHEYWDNYDVDADHNQKCDDYRRLCRNRARRRRLERTTAGFSFEEFEAWHEPGDWVTPDVVDAAHQAANAIEAATNTVRAMQTASDALEAISAARATTSVPARKDHHVTVDPVVSPITTNGPNGRRGPANTTCWSLGIDVQRHRLAA